MNEDTLVVFTSDNGPTWYDVDAERFGHDSAGPLRGMKADAWEAGHRVPFVVRWPGEVRPGSSSDRLICFTDLMATFADIFDVELPAEAGPDSYSFIESLNGQASKTPQRTEFVMRAGSNRQMMTIRQGRWKLITGLGSGGFTKPSRIAPSESGPAGQLYDLESDLGEMTNLYDENPEVVARLTDRLNEIVARDADGSER